MNDQQRGRLLKAAAVGAAAVPFAFAFIRALETGRDFRYFWVALGALCGGAAIIMVPRPSTVTPSNAIVRAAAMFVLATVLATLAALVIGTRFGLGIVVVAVAFGACVAFGGLLHLLALR